MESVALQAPDGSEPACMLDQRSVEQTLLVSVRGQTPDAQRAMDEVPDDLVHAIAS